MELEAIGGNDFFDCKFILIDYNLRDHRRSRVEKYLFRMTLHCPYWYLIVLEVRAADDAGLATLAVADARTWYAQ